MVDYSIFDKNKSNHSLRLHNCLKKIGYNGVFHSSFETIDFQPRIIFLPEIDQIPQEIFTRSSFFIGVSWAFDIQRNLYSEEGRVLLSKVYNKLSLLIVDCFFYYEKAVETGMRAERIWRMPYGVDLDTYSFFNKCYSKSNPFVFYSNRKWERGYGQDYILEAARLLFQEGKEFKVVFSNSGGTLNSLMSRDADLIEAGVIELKGVVTEEQNRNLLKSSDCYISASTQDGLSVSILESMATGTPVIASGIDQNREFIMNGENGFLYSPNSSQELASLMRNLIDAKYNTGTLSEVAARARSFVETHADLKSNLRLLWSDICERLNFE